MVREEKPRSLGDGSGYEEFWNSERSLAVVNRPSNVGHTTSLQSSKRAGARSTIERASLSTVWEGEIRSLVVRFTVEASGSNGWVGKLVVSLVSQDEGVGRSGDVRLEPRNLNHGAGTTGVMGVFVGVREPCFPVRWWDGPCFAFPTYAGEPRYGGKR